MVFVTGCHLRFAVDSCPADRTKTSKRGEVVNAGGVFVALAVLALVHVYLASRSRPTVHALALVFIDEVQADGAVFTAASGALVDVLLAIFALEARETLALVTAHSIHAG